MTRVVHFLHCPAEGNIWSTGLRMSEREFAVTHDDVTTIRDGKKLLIYRGIDLILIGEGELSAP